MTLTARCDVGMIAVCGPTCGGKTTLARHLIERWDSVFRAVVTTTTRQPRPGEVQGQHYHFVSRYEFDQMNERGWLVESDEVSGHCYGLTRQEMKRIIDGGRIGVAVVTPKGIEPIRQGCEALGKRLVSVYLGASRHELITRFLQRYRSDREDRAEHYADRLIHMLDEQVNWEREAHYDIVEKCFNDETFGSVVEQIQEAISGGAVWVADGSGLRATH